MAVRQAVIYRCAVSLLIIVYSAWGCCTNLGDTHVEVAGGLENCNHSFDAVSSGYIHPRETVWYDWGRFDPHNRVLMDAYMQHTHGRDDDDD